MAVKMGSLTLGCIVGGMVAATGAVFAGSQISIYQATIFLSAATIARAIEKLKKERPHAD